MTSMNPYAPDSEEELRLDSVPSAGPLASIHRVNWGDRFSGGWACGLISQVMAGVTYLPLTFLRLVHWSVPGIWDGRWPVQAAGVQ